MKKIPWGPFFLGTAVSAFLLLIAIAPKIAVDPNRIVPVLVIIFMAAILAAGVIIANHYRQ